ncbi:hypothetical protein [Streptomyces sp. NPDC008240]|uniref:hypothetical protein n=1 Tax=Streptomyces sp. NPDC008240 TaxID=3364822 RepID=UPI0036E9A192
MSEAFSGRQDLPARISTLWRLLLPGIAAPGMLPRLRTSCPPEPEIPTGAFGGTAPA